MEQHKPTRPLFTRPAVVTIIAYTNLLHLQSADPSHIKRNEPEQWNQQLTYAEQLLDWMINEGFFT